MKTILALYIVALCLVAWLLAVGWDKPEPTPTLYPLMLHTIYRGNSPKVVYLEKWTDPDTLAWITCREFEIVWPAGASKGYIDMMLETGRGEVRDHYRQVGWWMDSIKILK